MAFIIYIGAALAIGLLIGFVALSILWLRKTIQRNIRSHTIGLLSVYDELLEEKSQELSAVQEEIVEQQPSAAVETAPQSEGIRQSCTVETQVKPGVMLAAAERAATAPYRDGAAGEIYQSIRQNFSFLRVEELLPGLRGTQTVSGSAQTLLSQLNYDTVYQLSTLPEEQQLMVLRESLTPEGLALLESYLQTHRHFGALAFYDHLRSTASGEAQKARLYVSPGMLAFAGSVAGVELIPNAEICEGFQAEVDGKLYDYCITRRELN